MSDNHLSLPEPGAGGDTGSPFDRIMLLDHNGEERWSARDLQNLMGYTKWQEFDRVIGAAKSAVEHSGLDPLDHFMGARKVIKGGRWGTQQVADHRLTRFGAYHVALAGDGRKPEVAAAKTYFAVKTREAEVQQDPDVSSPEGVLALAEQYVQAARDLVATKRELAVAAPKAGKWDQFLNTEGLIGMREMADMFGMDARELTNWLVSKNVFRKQVSQRGGGRNMPRRVYQEQGMFTVKQESNGKVFYSVAYATAQGLDLIDDLRKKDNAA